MACNTKGAPIPKLVAVQQLVDAGLGCGLGLGGALGLGDAIFKTSNLILAKGVTRDFI